MPAGACCNRRDATLKHLDGTSGDCNDVRFEPRMVACYTIVRFRQLQRDKLGCVLTDKEELLRELNTLKQVLHVYPETIVDSG